MTFADLLKAHDAGEPISVYVAIRGVYSGQRVDGVYSSVEEAKQAYPGETWTELIVLPGFPVTLENDNDDYGNYDKELRLERFVLDARPVKK